MARPLISPRTMQTLRALSERAMPDQVTRERAGAPTSNGAGSITPGTPTSATSPCRVLDREQADRSDDARALIAGLRLDEAELVLFLPVSFDIAEQDVVTSLRRNGSTLAERWTVVYAPAPHTYRADRIVALKRG